MKKNILLSLIAVALTVQANAQTIQQSRTPPDLRPIYSRSESQPHIGVLGGVVDTDSSTDTAGEFGLDIGYQPYIPFGLGLEATLSTEAPDNNGGNSDRTSVLAKGTYNFGGDTAIIRYSYIGLGVGSIIRESNSYFAGGPLLGFDIPIVAKGIWTAGANAKYVFVDGEEPDALAVNAALKYWF